ncbi:MAG: hypothetical protein QNJ47_07875 [Nostocaceae cyanobacterium]|nr:hypothetical protein [Nostocaceae cyanobacterium]
MRTITDSVQTHPPGVNSQVYSPSVPLSVYRELAAQLQATQARVDALSSKNQQLIQENQQLRQEIAKAVQSVLHLQQFADTYNCASSKKTSGVNDSRNGKVPPTPPPQTPQYVQNQPSPFIATVVETETPPEPVIIEEQEVNIYAPSETEIKRISVWWLVLAMVVVTFMAFGAGYLIVRPLLENHSR